MYDPKAIAEEGGIVPAGISKYVPNNIELLLKGGLQNAPMNPQTSAPIPVPVPVDSQVSMGGPQVPMGGPQVPPRGGSQVPMGSSPAPMKQTLNEVLTMVPPPVPDENGRLKVKDSVGTQAVEGLIDRSRNTLIRGMVAQTRGIEDGTIGAYTGGGLMQLAAGGEFRGRVPGDGHGMEDNVYMPIRERNEDVGTLAVSPSEYVVDSYTMAALGNGNADEGADVMDEVVEQVRERAYGDRQQPNEINGLAALRPMLERV